MGFVKRNLSPSENKHSGSNFSKRGVDCHIRQVFVYYICKSFIRKCFNAYLSSLLTFLSLNIS